MRISVKGLLITVAAVAVGCAALLNASDVWAAVVYGATLVCLFVAIVGTIFRRGRPRAFWTGFAVFGWGYLLLMGANPLGDWSERLPTHLLLEKLHDVAASEEEAEAARDELQAYVRAAQRGGGYGEGSDGYGGGYGGGYGRGGYGGGYGRPRPKVITPTESDFRKVGHPLFLLLFASVGGIVGQIFSAAPVREKEAASTR